MYYLYQRRTHVNQTHVNMEEAVVKKTVDSNVVVLMDILETDVKVSIPCVLII